MMTEKEEVGGAVGSTARGGSETVPPAEPAQGETPTRDPEELASQLEQVRAQLAEAEAKARENWDLFLRARADLENYRRRVERDLAAMVRRGKKELVLRLLDVMDALDRAAAWEEQAEGSGGVGPIRRQLLKVLADEGVSPVECVGKPFDPALHEAVDVTVDPSAEGPTVTAELQKGYLYEEEVLRPARVRVSQPPG
ncbi:MAG: nucleotide exchange factor GrpE [Firmicutes bacterium]|nr:nucleotide exchange factor GrpE [Bacillota bacterium]